MYPGIWSAHGQRWLIGSLPREARWQRRRLFAFGLDVPGSHDGEADLADEGRGRRLAGGVAVDRGDAGLLGGERASPVPVSSGLPMGLLSGPMGERLNLGRSMVPRVLVAPGFWRSGPAMNSVSHQTLPRLVSRSQPASGLCPFPLPFPLPLSGKERERER